MGHPRHCPPALSSFPLLGGILVGLAARALHHRFLHHAFHRLVLVAQILQWGCADAHGVGRCHCLCLGGHLLPESLFLPEFRHPLLVFGENPPDGRLSAGVETELRPAHSANAADDAPHPAQSARVVGRWQELRRMAEMGLPACQRFRAGEARRHRGVQLPLGRYGGQQLSGAGLLPIGLLHRRTGARRQ